MITHLVFYQKVEHVKGRVHTDNRTSAINALKNI